MCESSRVRAGVAVIDLMTGMYATMAVQAALFERVRTGKGQRLDIALQDAGIALSGNQGLNYLVSGEAPERIGNAHPNLAPYEVFACADGYLILAVGNDAQFQKLCVMTDRTDLADDPRFATNPQRMTHLAALRTELQKVFPARTQAAWGKALEKAGISWGPIRSMDEVFDDVQVRYRDTKRMLKHPVMGEIPSIRNPVITPGTSTQDALAPPLLGEHSTEVLQDLGLAENEVAALRDRGILL